MKRRKCKRKQDHSGHEWKLSGMFFAGPGGSVAAGEETFWCPGCGKESDSDAPAVVPDPRA